MAEKKAAKKGEWMHTEASKAKRIRTYELRSLVNDYVASLNGDNVKKGDRWKAREEKVAEIERQLISGTRERRVRDGKVGSVIKTFDLKPHEIANLHEQKAKLERMNLPGPTEDMAEKLIAAIPEIMEHLGYSVATLLKAGVPSGILVSAGVLEDEDDDDGEDD